MTFKSKGSTRSPFFFCNQRSKWTRLIDMRLPAKQLFLVAAAVLSFSGLPVQAENEHPWVGIANASVFPQKLLNYRDAHGWSDLRMSVFKDAKYAYERKLPIAERLLYTFLWLDLLHQSEGEYVNEWVDKMGKANRLHSNMPSQIPYYEGALGDRLSDDFLRYFFSKGDLMRAGYNQWDPGDLLTEVLSILDRLYSENRYLFTQYPELAFAIAFVHDVPPTPLWPHPQVGQHVLPRVLRSPDEVFTYFTGPRNAKWFHNSIKLLSLSDAIFMVDLIATPEEVEWVRQHVTVSPLEYEGVYSMIQYDASRVQQGQMYWFYDDYSLPAIHQAGGICVDQAYFASQVGKIQGLPTIEFLGQGLDGRHAWFAYQNSRGKWQLDAGRYADQRFVTGHGFNPQTWDFISDHELQLLSAGYRSSQSFFKSQVHFYWARIYGYTAQLDQAEEAAEDAVAMERRNAHAWELLIDLRKRNDSPRNRIDASYRSALSALRNYSDLEAKFLTDFAEYLESTGRANAAKVARNRITFRNKDQRSDLAINNAVAILNESMGSDSRTAQMYVYKKLLYQLGEQAGIQLLDDLVVPFVGYLIKEGRSGDARTAVLEAEQVLQPKAGSTMAQDFAKVKSQLGL